MLPLTFVLCLREISIVAPVQCHIARRGFGLNQHGAVDLQSGERGTMLLLYWCGRRIFDESRRPRVAGGSWIWISQMELVRMGDTNDNLYRYEVFRWEAENICCSFTSTRLTDFVWRLQAAMVKESFHRVMLLVVTSWFHYGIQTVVYIKFCMYCM